MGAPYTPAKLALGRYWRAISALRLAKAEEHPDCAFRSVRTAEALVEAARYFERLPEDDPRVVRIDELLENWGAEPEAEELLVSLITPAEDQFHAYLTLSDAPSRYQWQGDDESIEGLLNLIQVGIKAN